MVDGSDDATCLWGLEGLAVERVVRSAVGVTVVQLVTDDPGAARCPGCGQPSTARRTVLAVVAHIAAAPR